MEIIESPNTWILVAFLFFFGLFGRKAYAKITELLDARASKIKTELETATQLRDEAQAVLADYERKRQSAEEEAKQMVEHARVEAERQAEIAREALEESMKRRTEMAMQRIARAEEDAMREVRQTAASLAIQAAGKLIRDNIDDARADKMVEESIEQVRAKLH